MEKEVFAILGPVGVDEHAARAVAKCLWNIERNATDIANIGTTTPIGDEEKQITGKRKDVGLTSFLLKFGQGLGMWHLCSFLSPHKTYYLRLEEVPTKRLYISAMTIGIGYLIGGVIPLLPYIFISRANVALLYSCILTGAVLLVFGGVKARVTGAANGQLGYLWGALSMLMVGGAAAAAAYGMVVLVEKAF